MNKTFWLGALAILACGAPKQEQKLSGKLEMEKLAENVTQERQGNERVLRYDVNHDQKPDVWEHVITVKNADGKDVDRIVRKELDLNADGKPDIIRYYDDKEQIDHEALDEDFDGKVDVIQYFEKGIIVRKERDFDADGKPHEWLFFEKGHLVRKEKDVKHTGKVDYWEYWENDQIDRIGEDLDGDGRVDRWTKNPNSVEGT